MEFAYNKNFFPDFCIKMINCKLERTVIELEIHIQADFYAMKLLNGATIKFFVFNIFAFTDIIDTAI